MRDLVILPYNFFPHRKAELIDGLINDTSMNFVIECFLCVLQKEKEKEE